MLNITLNRSSQQKPESPWNHKLLLTLCLTGKQITYKHRVSSQYWNIETTSKISTQILFWYHWNFFVKVIRSLKSRWALIALFAIFWQTTNVLINKINRLINCENCYGNKPQTGVLPMFGCANQPMWLIKNNWEHGLIYSKLTISYNPGRIVYLCLLNRDTENADLLILPLERHETLKGNNRLDFLCHMTAETYRCTPLRWAPPTCWCCLCHWWSGSGLFQVCLLRRRKQQTQSLRLDFYSV